MKKKPITHQVKRFLALNNAYLNYVNAINSKGHITANKFISNHSNHRPQSLISGAFFWDRSAQGHSYWNKLHNLWAKEQNFNVFI